MKHVLRALCVVGGLSAFLNAQPQDPAARPADAGKGDLNPLTVTGCLEEEAGGRFSLKEEAVAATAAGKTYRLSASGGVDLKTHVGHKVQVTGTKTTKEPTATPGETKDLAMLKVTSVTKVSDTCTTVK